MGYFLIPKPLLSVRQLAIMHWITLKYYVNHSTTTTPHHNVISTLIHSIICHLWKWKEIQYLYISIVTVPHLRIYQRKSSAWYLSYTLKEEYRQFDQSWAGWSLEGEKNETWVRTHGDEKLISVNASFHVTTERWKHLSIFVQWPHFFVCRFFIAYSIVNYSFNP